MFVDHSHYLNCVNFYSYAFIFYIGQSQPYYFADLIQNGDETSRSDIRVPLNSNLVVDLEVISWKRVIDVTGDKKVTKKIMKEGEGYDCPREGSQVKGMTSFCIIHI